VVKIEIEKGFDVPHFIRCSKLAALSKHHDIAHEGSYEDSHEYTLFYRYNLRVAHYGTFMEKRVIWPSTADLSRKRMWWLATSFYISSSTSVGYFRRQ